MPAKYIPMHLCTPAPNAWNASRCTLSSWRSAEKRSGSKRSGSGQTSSRKWLAYGELVTNAPSGIR